MRHCCHCSFIVMPPVKCAVAFVYLTLETKGNGRCAKVFFKVLRNCIQAEGAEVLDDAVALMLNVDTLAGARYVLVRRAAAAAVHGRGSKTGHSGKAEALFLRKKTSTQCNRRGRLCWSVLSRGPRRTAISITMPAPWRAQKRWKRPSHRSGRPPHSPPGMEEWVSSGGARGVTSL